MKKQLELFRDGKLSKAALVLSNPRPKNIEPITISAHHVIHILLLYKNHTITKDTLLEWVNTVWFSDYFVYNIEHSDAIASVMVKLEECEEFDISPSMVHDCIQALTENRLLE